MKLWWRKKPLVTGGEEARKRAEVGLARTRAETPKYAALGAELREIRERNHLTELFLSLHQGRGRG